MGKPAPPPPGEVYLIGAGPGDPDLITLRGVELIRQADVVLYDNLATPALLVYAGANAKKMYVGKKRSDHALSQQDINSTMIELALSGKRVARLKGGDPYIFGRGGEEGEALAEAGVRFEVCPGVSSALGVAAYSGIPLTHRDKTQAAVFITGHDVASVDWSKFAGSETLVIFMGLTSFRDIAHRLIAAGRPPQTPAAAIRWGTRPDQRTVTATIADLAERVEQSSLRPPALVIVGEVVALRRKLNWFERLPLFGRRIAVTRAAEQADETLHRLRRLGADAIAMPTIEIGAPADWGPVDRAIGRLEAYDWLIFTSVNGVRRFVSRLDESSRDLRALRGRICAIGPATAAALEALHLVPDVTPKEFIAESLVEALAGEDVEGKCFLLPRAAEARELIPVELERRGAVVDVAPVYRTVPPNVSAAEADEAFEPDRRPHWITFTSSSTARNFVKLYGAARLGAARAASIGPVTSQTLRELGVEPAVEASPHTTEGLIEAILHAEEK